jgi:hypothetical protein
LARLSPRPYAEELQRPGRPRRGSFKRFFSDTFKKKILVAGLAKS